MVPKIRTLTLQVFVPWAITVAKKLENCTSPFLPENELEQHIYSATCQRIVSKSFGLSVNLHTTPDRLSNYHK